MAEKAVKMPFLDNFLNFQLIFLQMLNVGLINITITYMFLLFLRPMELQQTQNASQTYMHVFIYNIKENYTHLHNCSFLRYLDNRFQPRHAQICVICSMDRGRSQFHSPLYCPLAPHKPEKKAKSSIEKDFHKMLRFQGFIFHNFILI